MNNLPKTLYKVLPQKAKIKYVAGLNSDDVGIWHIFFSDESTSKQNGKELEVSIYDQESFYAEWWLWKDGKDNFGKTDNVEDIIKLFKR